MIEERKRLILNSITSIKLTTQAGMSCIDSHKWQKEISTTLSSQNKSLISRWLHKIDKQMIVYTNDQPRIRQELREELIKAYIIVLAVPAVISLH